MELVISKADYHRVAQHLESTYPNEGGGFLVGTIAGDVRTVLEVHPVQNVFETEEQFHRFLAEDGAFERLEDDADARGLSLIGYFHSHPDSPAIASEFDRVHAWPFFAYLIVRVQDGKAEDGHLWVLTSDRSAFEEKTLTIKETIQS